MTIKILPDEVASQIAAGEVIERPASVIKELLENSLDAGSRQINITVEEAGKRLIEVADDGDGIEGRELPLSIARHATSKLRTADDLFRITTLGFRGEALASIASVARLTITSHHISETVGAKFQVEGGKIGSLEKASSPVGTDVKVEDLFFNVPARLKFLKQDSTERKQIDGLVMRYALAYPEIRFKLTQDNRLSLQTTGNGLRREVLASLYGLDVARQMLEVNFRDEDIEVNGFISPISLTKNNRRGITLFVNGRWIQDIALTSALVQAYHTLLMVGRYPMATLFLQIPTEFVDVNVHPAKAEVRFRQPEKIFSSVQRAAKRALLAYSPIPRIEPGSAWIGGNQNASIDKDPAFPPVEGNTPSEIDLTLGIHPDSSGSYSPLPVQPALAPNNLPILRLIGQVGGTYLVAEGPDGLYLIDQHAAHERVLFEKFMNHPEKRTSQYFLDPVTIHLPPDQARSLEEMLPLLEKIGFNIDLFGPATFLIRALPTLFAESDPVTIVNTMVADFEEDETPLQAEIESRIIARICKRAAVKGGKTLHPDEQNALLSDLENCSSPRTCPHGRPTMIHLSVDLLERQFGRRGAR
jgi:DNA mismatch repair protein MutL